MSTVCVVGLGKIGLPLACAIARGGHTVIGADIDASVVAMVNAAEEPFPGEAGLGAALMETVGSRSLRATTDTTSAVRDSDVVMIVVPLVVDENAAPDFRAMDAATAAVAAGLQKGTLVSYETTLPVGTTRHRFAPTLSDLSGLECGVDFFVVHSPERVFSGRIFSDLRRYPKLVGGVEAASARRGIAFYESFLDFDERPDLPKENGVWNLGSCEAAEMAKLAETTYRDINIAFANELALAAESAGVDVYEMIDACNSQPFSHIHRPGISVGGHCIPVYPHFLMASTGPTELPLVARAVNDSMPLRAVKAVRGELGDLAGRTVAILGLAFRPGVKEEAFSGAHELVRLLDRAGAAPVVHDPLYTAEELLDLGFQPFQVGSACDAAIIHTAHPEYLAIEDFVQDCMIYDGRACLGDVDARYSVYTLGIGRRSASD